MTVAPSLSDVADVASRAKEREEAKTEKDAVAARLVI